MDPIAVLQNRIEQLEAKLGLAPNIPENVNQHHGDSATANLLHAAQGITNATAGHEKLPEAMHLASELNNYTDPNLAENVSLCSVYTFVTPCDYSNLVRLTSHLKPFLIYNFNYSRICFFLNCLFFVFLFSCSKMRCMRKRWQRPRMWYDITVTVCTSVDRWEIHGFIHCCYFCS